MNIGVPEGERGEREGGEGGEREERRERGGRGERRKIDEIRQSNTTQYNNKLIIQA